MDKWNKWIKEVRKIKKEKKISFKEAMIEASKIRKLKNKQYKTVKDKLLTKKQNKDFLELLTKNLNNTTTECDKNADIFYCKMVGISYKIFIQASSNSEILNFTKIKDNKNYILRLKIKNINTNLQTHSIVLILYYDKAYLIQSYIELYNQNITIYNRNEFLKNLENINTKIFLDYFIYNPLKLKYKLNEIIELGLEYIQSKENKAIYLSLTYEQILHQFYIKNNPKKATKSNILKILNKYKDREEYLIEALENKYTTFIPTFNSYKEQIKIITTIPNIKSNYLEIIDKLIEFINIYFNSEPKFIYLELLKWKQLLFINSEIVKSKSIKIYNIFLKNIYIF